MGEMISKRTRNEFREAMVAMTLAEIQKEFDSAEIACDKAHNSDLSGQRRTYVEQFYHTLNFSSVEDTKRLLEVYESVMERLQIEYEQHQEISQAEATLSKLKSSLKRDGFDYVNKEILPNESELKAAFQESNSTISISKVTRRNIFDAFILGGFDWTGRLSVTDFLDRLYELDKMPSNDKRFINARGDIWQHVENNIGDWNDDWIFSDSRFNLYGAKDEEFLNFLCQTIHPLVRENSEEVDAILKIYNENLCIDGWKIREISNISGKPVFAATKSMDGYFPMISSTKEVAKILDEEYVSRQITRMEASVKNDPELAIGTAKEFLETICKSILLDLGMEISSSIDLSELVRKVTGAMNLLPENISQEKKGCDAIKRVLGSFGSVTKSIVELRSLYGSGHGKISKHKGLGSRHARLAVGAAATVGVFLFETYMEQKT